MAKKKTIKSSNALNVIAQLQQTYGNEMVVNLTENYKCSWPSISTGSLAIDEITGIGGYPQGRMIEIFGPESSGKTTLVLHAIAEAQKAGHKCAFIDAEHALDPVYAQKLGVNLADLIFIQPDSGEQATDAAILLVESGEVGFIAIDSIPAMTPQAEIDGEMDDQVIGGQARLLSKFYRKVIGPVKKNNVTLCMINQIRTKIGGMSFGSNETTPGGKATRFYASMRVDIRRTGQLKASKESEAYGHIAKIKIVKNKLASPHRICNVDIVYGKGVDPTSEVLNLGLEYDVLKKSGSFVSYDDTRLGNGKMNTINFLDENIEIRDEIRKKISNLIEAKYKDIKEIDKEETEIDLDNVPTEDEENNE